MPVKIIDRTYTHLGRPADNNIDWLLGNVGVWQKLTLTCEFEVAINFTTTNVLFMEEPNTFTLGDGSEWREQGFEVGDNFEVKWSVTDSAFVTQVYTVTGTIANLSSAIVSQCIANTDLTLTNPVADYQTEYGTWVTNPITVADTLTNIWLSICDIYNSLPGTDVTVIDTNTIDLDITADKLISAKVKDTGWVDLEGFDFYSGSATKPQVRRIGNVLHFRGYVFVPLDNGAGGIHGLSSFADYNNIPTCVPALGGAGAVTISVGGVISFNGGSSVIPTSVTSDTFDADYRMPYPGVLSRPIVVTGAYGSVLTGACRIGITDAGVLYIGSLRDQEEISGASGFIGGSHLRFITSNVRSGESIPNYINTASDIHNFPATGVNALVAETDFSGADYTWPFTCDAGEANELGGFFATIEGLTAFLDCDADIVETTCY